MENNKAFLQLKVNQYVAHFEGVFLATEALAISNNFGDFWVI